MPSELFLKEVLAAREAAAKTVTGYELLNAEVMAKFHPTTFEIPDLHEREDVLPSQNVRLCFRCVPAMEGHPSAERMWVRVSRMERKDGKVRYAGVLNNDPAVFPDLVLKCGDRVDFGPEHILSIMGE